MQRESGSVTVCLEDEWADQQVTGEQKCVLTAKKLEGLARHILCAGKCFECQATYLELLS